ARAIKEAALRTAYRNGFATEKLFVEDYYGENAHWLDDYCAFMIIRQIQGEAAWYNWQERYRNYSRQLVEEVKEKHSEQFWYYVFCQYIFDEQWHMVKRYANDKGIAIIGDIPIYVAADSVDAWANGELFLMDDDKRMTQVAGCPPDAFSESGQHWGNPVYDWQALADSDYSWWVARLKQVLKYYDSVRIDHFRGFESYWSIPAAAETARAGKWVKGPGIALFDAIRRQLGEVDIIAEDLGLLTDDVIALREACGFPGMKVLQFAFDAAGDSLYLPHNLTEDSVVYTGTHDNDTVIGWTKTVDRDSLQYAIEYLKLDEAEGYAWGFIRAAWRSVCRIAIAPMQDFLNLDSAARINTPATVDGNWLWRLDSAQLDAELAARIAKLTKCYRR
ncbi:MAG: 4-alpha-glucanotransferase, partial [Clostridiales bacterium]